MSIRNGMPAADLPEVTWHKSRRSGPQGGNCVEVANLPDGRVAVRNSRHPAGPALVFTAAEWAAFVGGARDGDFDCARDGRRPSRTKAGLWPDTQRAVDPPGPPPSAPSPQTIYWCAQARIGKETGGAGVG